MSQEAEFSFKLCSSAVDLRAAHRLRLEVFHQEQHFPKETEVDEYDPISAHFILMTKEDGKVVATVRLTPYPRREKAGGSKSEWAGKQTGPGSQNDTAMATSGGGPGGTSGGLPMTAGGSSTSSGQAPAPKSDKGYHTGIAKQDQPSGLTSSATSDHHHDRGGDDEVVEHMGKSDNGYPLGGPQSESSLAHQFMKKLRSKGVSNEDHGAPRGRGAKLSRLAVCKTMRGKGLGALTVREAEAWLSRVLGRGGGSREGAMGEGGQPVGEAESGGIQSLAIIISSQLHAKGFYERLSYVVEGEPYDEEGAPHTWCTKRIVYQTE